MGMGPGVADWFVVVKKFEEPELSAMLYYRELLMVRGEIKK